ncbi:MAG TPA: transglutaminaseTgpA domain-containing protein [Pseudomonadales bacterium]
MASAEATHRASRAATGVAYQIPRNSLALLMAAQVAVVVPYLLQLSPWIVAVGLFCGMWRTNVYLGRWDYPQRWVKAVLVVACLGGVAISGVGAFSLEATASLLIAAFALKLIEMKSRRDAYVVIFLGYFAIATQFLFDQTILVTVYQLVAFMLVTAAMVGMNQRQSSVRPMLSLKLAGVLVLQALPLTLVMFLLFPRMAPLWTVPLPGAGTVGLADTMRPGDIANLTQSDELAFRAVIDGRVPPPSRLYWRGLVYSDFEAGSWRAAERRRAAVEPIAEPGDLSYEVLLEPTMQTWLFALENSTSDNPGTYRTVDGRLESREPVLSVFRYRAVRHERPAVVEPISEALRLRETAIDPDANPRIQALGRALLAEHETPMAMTRAVLGMIAQHPYRYTLSPPTYQGRDSIDEFWFDGRSGFCAHYAGAYVYLMRAAGIPARLVGGYLGGEVNPISGHVMVRQYDAHAWAEIFDPEIGWRRVDPTAAVAPERVERGLSAALSAEDRATLSMLTAARLGDWDLAAGFLRWADSLEHRWNLWVVGYDSSFQSRVLRELLGRVTPARIGLAVLVGGGLSLGAVALVVFWGRRPVQRHPVEKVFRDFSDKLAGFGYPRRIEESPSAYLRRVAQQVGLAEAQIGGLVAELETLLYNPAVAWGQQELRALRAQLRRLQFRLAFGTNR